MTGAILPGAILPGLDLTGYAPPDPGLSQWYTPPVLAVRLVRWGLGFSPMGRDDVALEPSVGRGAIVEALLAEGIERVVGVDLDARNVTPWGGHARVTVHHADFMEWVPEGGERFAHAFMNPPYERDADVQHIRRALDGSYAVTALVRSALLHVRRAVILRPYVIAVAALTGRPKFTGAVDGSPLSDFVLLHLRARPRSRGVPVHFGWIP